MVRLIAGLGAMALVACSPNGSAAQDTAPAPAAETGPALSEAGLQLTDVTVVSGDERHTFTTELALTNAEQARGMMFRTEMGDDEGMLFPSYQPQARSFWMKNTPLPLDIIFIGPGNRITNIEAGVPYSTDSVFSDGPAVAVFEIRGGLSEELGIKPGDMVEWELPE
ncbi:DUF192 domain-containing protein [Erythrobacter sp. NAP1]|uniref:DUF192 domain-containing protein n=1 Tax=Erythrobacter sp. NAP1 TaxID=237727 RepID=UPI0002F445BC|nr:DUF192 domain-containing protein [Erythrobacter sp. NAP1]